AMSARSWKPEAANALPDGAEPFVRASEDVASATGF
ncbi:MAG: hypothetical protein JWM82_4030, partial [Myxococcales bacterium]|nr:hypothetical protein [Myxococcales bacterium]